MDARQDDPELEDAELNPDYRGSLDHKLVRALRKTMNIVRNAVDHRGQLAAFRGLNFEQLSGKRSHQYSMRLNDQFRLIVEFERIAGTTRECCVVIGIENHYGD